jgi:flagellar biosynthesis anti-sigma factor FlgM
MTKPAAPSADRITHPSAERDIVQKLKTRLYALPEVRQQRVEALKQAIQDGTYKILPYAVATAMLSDRGPEIG